MDEQTTQYLTTLYTAGINTDQLIAALEATVLRLDGELVKLQADIADLVAWMQSVSVPEKHAGDGP